MVRSKKQQPHGKRTTKEAVNDYGLTALQEQFCHAYLIRFNVLQAERLVGSKVGMGYKWMQLPKVRERINKIRIDSGKAFDVTRERILQELMNVIFADSRKLVDADVVDWGDEEIAAVAGVEYDLMGDIKTVKRWDKLKAMEILNKMLGYNMPETTKNLNVNTEPLNKEEAIEIAKLLRTAV